MSTIGKDLVTALKAGLVTIALSGATGSPYAAAVNAKLRFPESRGIFDLPANERLRAAQLELEGIIPDHTLGHSRGQYWYRASLFLHVCYPFHGRQDDAQAAAMDDYARVRDALGEGQTGPVVQAIRDALTAAGHDDALFQAVYYPDPSTTQTGAAEGRADVDSVAMIHTHRLQVLFRNAPVT